MLRLAVSRSFGRAAATKAISTCSNLRRLPFRIAFSTVPVDFVIEQTQQQDPPPERGHSLGAALAPTGHSNSEFHSSAECSRQFDREALNDLFFQYATHNGDSGELTLDYDGIAALMRGIGEEPREKKIHKLFEVADLNSDGVISLDEFQEHAASFLGGNPARIILIVGGPGSGKGVLSQRLQTECNVAHLSSGKLLRDEVEQGTALGRQVRDIMARGELVSSAIMVALMKKRMQDHPGKRVLLDGFPRSQENAEDLVSLCGRPELALHLECDDTILMERIMKRGKSAATTAGQKSNEQQRREDDNFYAALQRLRTYHEYHDKTLMFLREQHVPIINLDCSGDPDSVWNQLVAIGRLMRPAVKVPNGNGNGEGSTAAA